MKIAQRGRGRELLQRGVEFEKKKLLTKIIKAMRTRDFLAVVACAFFAAISGSGAATTAAIGAMMIPEMARHGYDKSFAAATCASGGCIGIIEDPWQ